MSASVKKVLAGAAKSAATVTVACKIPAGLELQMCREVRWMEDTPSGSRERVRFDKYGPPVFLRGTARPVGPPPKGYPPAPSMAGGYALTPNVSLEFWDAWLAQNKDNPLVTSGMIFAHTSRGHAIGQAKDQKELRSGLEPLTPDTDSRMPKPITAGVTPLQTAEEMQGRELAESEAE